MTDSNYKEGRKLVLRPQGSLENFLEYCYLGEEFSFSAGSNYTQPFNFGSDALTNLGSIVSGVSGGDINFSGQNAYFSYQVWQSAEPISISLPVTFYMGQRGLYSARKEVYEPAITLIGLTLPSEGAGGNLSAPSLTVFDALVDFYDQERAMFSDILDWFDNPLTEGVVDDLQGALAKRGQRKSNKLSFRVGNILELDNVIVKKAEPTWSAEMADDGYPIEVKINIEINSAKAGTKEAVEEFATR